MPVPTAERPRPPRGLRCAALAAPTAALVLLAGCGGDSRDEDPELLQEGTLTVALAAAPPEPSPTGPASFHRELIADLAGRLELEVVFREAAAGPPSADLLAKRVDAAAPVTIADPGTEEVDYTAPYYEDAQAETLYGLAVGASPDPEQETALLEDLDEALSELKDDGTLQELYDKWFPGTDVPDPVLNDATE